MNTQNRRQFLKSLGAVAAGGLMMGGAALVATKQPKNDGWLTKEEFLAKLDRQNNRIVGEKIKIDCNESIDLSNRESLNLLCCDIEFRGKGYFYLGEGHTIRRVEGNRFNYYRYSYDV